MPAAGRLLLLWFVWLPAMALAKPPADRRAWLTVVVNTVPHGEALVILRGADVLVEHDVLEDAGVLPSGGQLEVIDHKLYLSLASLAPALHFAIDEEALALRISAAPDMLPQQLVRLRPEPPDDLVRRHDTSGFLNYALRLTDLTHFDGFSELGVSIRGALLYSSVSISSQTWTPVRGLSYVHFNEPRKMRRWTLGDAFTATGPLGSGELVGGITVARSFDLDPYYVRFPTFDHRGVALTPSTLEVYVNDRLVRREAVDPGTFHVEDVPVTAGGGTTRYVLRDSFGRQTELASRYYFASGLLGRGVQDYAYSLGGRRNHLGTSSFDYDELVLLGRHRYGLTDRLTLGGRVEASLDLLSGGASLTIGTLAGELDLAAAGSVERGGAGAAGLLSWAFLSRHFGASVYATAATPHYATLGTRAADDRPLVDVAASVSLPIGRAFTVAAQYGLSYLRDSGLRDRVSGSLAVRIASRWSFSASASWSRPTGGGGGVLEAFAGITWSPGGALSIGAGWHQRGRDGAATLDALRPLPRGSGVGYRFHGEAGPDHEDLSAEVQAQHPYGRVTAGYDFVGGQQHTHLELAGGLVAIAGGGLFATRPVQQGFALIRVPGVRGVRGLVDNQEVGRTDRHGNLLVPDLLPYYANRLAIVPADVPLDRTIATVEQRVAPPERGGAVVLFPVERRTFVRGRLRARRGTQLIVPAYGELTIDADEQHPLPLGAAGELELQDLAPRRYRAHAVWDGGQCSFTLEVPDRDGAVIDLGELTCPFEENR